MPTLNFNEQLISLLYNLFHETLREESVKELIFKDSRALEHLGVKRLVWGMVSRGTGRMMDGLPFEDVLNKAN